jgi:GNAT superfamily N-acetyltransferase
MTQDFHIAPASALHPGMELLRTEAINEGFLFVDRLVRDWTSGSNRFDLPGEQLLGAFAGETLIGVCGINRDPTIDQDGIGRLRHLYVRECARHRGVASALVQRLLDEASNTFRIVRLRTTTREAAAFYLRHGFVPLQDQTAPHVKALRPHELPLALTTERAQVYF